MAEASALPSALDVGLAVARKLRGRGVSYALGGALALGVAGVLRATRDVDINVFVGPAELDATLGALAELGIETEPARARASAEQEGMFQVWSGPWRLDVFVPSIEFSWEAERTRIEVQMEGETFWFLSAEALAVFKLLFFRTKDLLDLEQLLAVRTDLDAGWIRHHLAGMMGEEDPRVAEWDRLVRSR